MIGHLTLEPTAPDRTAVEATATGALLHAGGPSRDAAATWADLVCADRELLAAEFDAIITANVPDSADGPRPDDRSVPVLTGTGLVPPCRARHPYAPWPPRGVRTVAPHPHPRPRERGPPPHDARTGTRPAAPPLRGRPLPIGHACGDRHVSWIRHLTRPAVLAL